MNTFKKKSLITRMKMPLPELEAYHRVRREDQYERNTAMTGIKWRKLIHPILLLVLAVSRAISKARLHIVQDLHTKSKKPVIFASIHIGWKDIEMNFAAVKTHFYGIRILIEKYNREYKEFRRIYSVCGYCITHGLAPQHMK